MPEENPLDLIRKRTIVYRVPEMDAVSVRRDVEYMSAPGEPRTLDLYIPTHQESRSGLPALVFVMGYPDAGMKAMLGCRAKEIGQYTSWARLAAASGMIGVTYSAQEPATETLAVLRYLRENARSLNLDPERIGIWSCSGNVPNALGVLTSEAPGAIRCAVFCYGLMLDLDGLDDRRRRGEAVAIRHARGRAIGRRSAAARPRSSSRAPARTSSRV